MFHVEHKMFFFGAVSAIVGTAPLFAEPVPALPLVLATNDAACSTNISRGMEELIYGDDIEAAKYFQAALQAGDECSPLAYVGLFLTGQNSTETTRALNELVNRKDDLVATPTEAFYLSALLCLANHGVAQAQTEFSNRADKYRADTFSAVWATHLLHYLSTGYGDNAEIHPLQKEALDRAKALYKKNPDNPVYCFLRAQVEEAAPEISDEAMVAAKRAYELLPDHPTVLHLYAHFQYRTGHTDDASNIFHQAAALARGQGKEMPALQAEVYESVSLWAAGKEKDALTICHRLNQLPVDANPKSQRTVFLTWETRTLPLRYLILRNTKPTQASINSAAKEALPNGEKGTDCYTSGVLCIQYALQARLFAQQKKTNDALATLKKAESFFKKYCDQQSKFLADNKHLTTPYLRMSAACSAALDAARATIYPESQAIWQSKLEKTAASPGMLQMAPVVPGQQKSK